jgi:hypothetical protein
MRGRLKSLSLSLALFGALAVGPVAASPAAAAGGCTSTTSGGTVTTPPTISGGTIAISQTVHVIFGTACPPGSTSNDSSWTPPACWWAPVFTPDALKAYAYANFVNASSADLTWQQMLQYYETDGGKGETTPPGYKSTDGPPYSNWNINASPGGMWWSLVFNEDMIGTPQFGDCLNHTLTSDGEPWSWVPDANGGPTNVTGPIITQGELAQYAASIIQLPASDFSSDPTAGQTVNLPTWVWAGNAATGTYAPQRLRLCTNYPVAAPICATVTATATTFTIDPGTPNNAADALVYDSGCTVNANGTVGTPYTGQPGLPPCGLTYLHSTPQNTLYYPSVTVKWSVTWNGGGAGWPKTDTMPGAVHQMTVQEIQSIVGH